MFGSAKAGEALIENVSSGIDKLWYTSEEKAEDAAQAKREGMAVYMKWLESTSGSRIARRLIALVVTGIWAVEHVMSVLFETMAVFTNDAGVLTSAKFIEASNSLSSHANDNNALVGVVLLFYFGGPAAIDGVKGLVGKWANKGDAPHAAK
jgi:hypothetical protein